MDLQYAYYEHNLYFLNLFNLMQKFKAADKKRSRHYNDNAPLFSKLDFDHGLDK